MKINIIKDKTSKIITFTIFRVICPVIIKVLYFLSMLFSCWNLICNHLILEVFRHNLRALPLEINDCG